jgi:hypothetical protein
MRKLILGSLVAAALTGISIPAAARTNVDFSLHVGPPVAPVEYVPAPRRGYVWIPGYWDWKGHRHHWVRGHWKRHRPGYYYEPARWVHRGGRYYYRAAGWRDADRDGVPNRYDRAPLDPRWR